MMARSIGLTPELYEYLLSVSPPEHPLLARLREETAGMRGAGMQIGRDQGALFQLLVRAAGVIGSDRRRKPYPPILSMMAASTTEPPDGRSAEHTSELPSL